jgi:HD-GYP domain-containing protein (c-di-GMP phosphodiesterase class II)
MATLKKSSLKPAEGAPPTEAARGPEGVSAASEAASHVDFSTDDLVPDSELNSPIYDKSGVLLLAKGSLVTSRFKELLVTRGVRDIKLSLADAQAMRAHKSAGALTPALANVELDADVVKKLDDLVDSGKLFLDDASPKFKERLVRHGVKGYDRQLREQLIAKHTETCSLLDDMIKAAAHGETMNGADISTVVADYLSHLTLDSDLVADVMARARDFAGIAQHCLQMALLGMSLAIELNMGEDSVRLIGMCGLLHDWGMIYVPLEVRDTPRVLSRLEYLTITKHVMHTVNMLEKITGLPPQVAMICYQVHERPDGSGYPRGKRKENIHPCARILNVADTFIAMTSPRPYRPPLKPHAAIECLLRQAVANQVDNEAVGALLRIVTQFGIGRKVLLSDGSKAVVLRRNGNRYNQPIVRRVELPDGTPVDRGDESQVINLDEAELTVTQVLPSLHRKELGFSEDLRSLSRS